MVGMVCIARASHRPGVDRPWYFSGSVEPAVGRANLRSGGCRPGRSVPMHCVGVIEAAVLPFAYAPHIRAAYGSRSEEDALVHPHVCAWNDRPARSVPVFCKRFKYRTVVKIADSPDVIGRP